MENIATFEKVSFEEYLKARGQMMPADTDYAKDKIFKEWENIKLPKRSTSGAAGYDFHIPFNAGFNDKPRMIPTGIRARIEDGWALFIFPRSGFGTKFGMHLANTAGIIDPDYYFATNEGHIMAMIGVTQGPLLVNAGDRFIQGVLLPYGTATNGNTDNQRTGGLGSTGRA